MKRLFLLATLIVLASNSIADEVALSGTELAHKLSSLQQNGSSFVRLKLEIQQPPGSKKVTLQLQIKQRRTAELTEILYQVLWPKERNGEAVLLRKTANEAATVSVLTPPNTIRTLNATQMKDGMFGSDLSYADVTENFFAWKQQTLSGKAIVDRVSCQILESKPGKGDSTPFAMVRTWVDAEHLVPMRVEKYLSNGNLGCRIETTKTAKDDGQHVPANLRVQGTNSGSLSLFEGSSIKHDVVYDAHTFTADGMKEMTAPKGM